MSLDLLLREVASDRLIVAIDPGKGHESGLADDRGASLSASIGAWSGGSPSVTSTAQASPPTTSDNRIVAARISGETRPGGAAGQCLPRNRSAAVRARCPARSARGSG